MPTRAGYPQIVDRQPGSGPIAGISAALLEHPKAAWLVIACDLPFLTEQTLQHLIAHRDPHKIATAYRSAHDGLPEPLCAIWEPAARESVLAYIASGKQCPRKFLINADSALLDLPDAQALDNVNTQEEFGCCGQCARRSGPSAERSKRCENGARSVLRDPARASRAQRRNARYERDTAAELYAELQQRHPFQLAPAQLKVAVNSEFGDWQTPLKHGDTVVFIPPVAGG